MRRGWRALLLALGVIALTSVASSQGALPPPAPPAAPATSGPSPAQVSLPRPARAPLATAAHAAARALAAAPPAASAALTWTYLSDLPWRSATSGLLALADQNEPIRDQAFQARSPLVLAGQVYAKGLGTLPFSEIEYALPPDAVAFRAVVGINDVPAMEGGSATFHVFGDGVELWASDVVRRGEPPRAVELNVAGVQRLRLVVADAGDGNVGDYADWADAAIARDPAAAGAPAPLAEQVAAAEAARRQAVEGEEGRLYALAAAELAVADQVLEASAQAPAAPAAGPGGPFHVAGLFSAQPTPTPPPGLRAGWDVQRGLVLLSSDRLLLTLGLGGPSHGLLSAVDRRAGRLLFYDTTPALRLASGATHTLHAATVPAGSPPYTLAPVDDPVLGRGLELTAPLALKDGPGRVALRLALFAAQPYFTLQLSASDLPAGERVARWTYFAAGAPGGFVTGDDAAYLADRSRLWLGGVPDDGFVRRVSLEPTKPLVFWNGRASALLATLLDCLDGPAFIGFRREPGRAVTDLDLTFDDLLVERSTASPRLLVEALPSADLRQAATNYRRIMDALYPPAPAPTWLRNQLGSWYIWGPSVTDADLRRQIDYLATYLADLGPWHVVIDAGWHVAYGQADAEFRAVDYDKFPHGIRAVVDYAHARGVKVVLYLPTGYVHDGRGDGEWLALPELVRAHPDWLIPIYTQGDVGRYLLDYRRPAVQAHIARTLDEALIEFDADGISLDGLADSEGQLIPLPLRQTWQGAAPIQRSHEIYALFARLIRARKPDAYIETGWVTPTCARPHATTFRYADEVERYENPYPFGGFETHLDYALVQRLLFGQRANMGANLGDPNRPDALTWLRGALAAGVQATLSFDLTRMTPQTLGRYRAHLAHYYPFAGETRFDGAVLPTSFATVRGPLAYLGVINREQAPRTVQVALEELGLDAAARYTGYEPESDTFRAITGSLEVTLPAKSFRLYVLRREPGVLWTTSSFEETAAPGEVRVRVDGPGSVPGVLWLASAEPAAVLLDGAPLPALVAGAAGSGYRYHPAPGVLEVRYEHVGPREIAVRWPAAP